MSVRELLEENPRLAVARDSADSDAITATSFTTKLGPDRLLYEFERSIRGSVFLEMGCWSPGFTMSHGEPKIEILRSHMASGRYTIIDASLHVRH